MQEVRCTKCGEPWALDSLHDFITDEKGRALSDLRQRHGNFGREYQAEYEKRFWNPTVEQFRREGCVMFGTSHNTQPNKLAAQMSEALMDMMGDDIDGVAAMLEDAGY